MSVDKTLDERGARYGEFIQHAEIAQGLQAVLAKMPNWPTMDYDMRQALCVICDKIARIGNGDPFYADNWHDIQGYAKLVENRILSLPTSEQELFDARTTVNEVRGQMGKASLADLISPQPDQNKTMEVKVERQLCLEEIAQRIRQAVQDQQKPKGWYEA